ncbi:MAG: YmdB family metallophosphoesterase [Pseudobdellovibrionaceae bacterium]
MRIVFIGDIVGRPGRDAVEKHVSAIREKYSPDVIIMNAENSAHGFGLTEEICKDLYGMGADCITTGNHVWDQREMLSYITRDKRVIRAANFPEGTPGQGHYLHQLPDGRKILVIHLLARTFMDPLDCPFKAADQILAKYRLGAAVNAIFVDIHGETTSEKMAMAHYLDGRVSAVIGTHTHVPTADACIYDGGTAYQTDAGMSGNYNSVIGMDKEAPLIKFTKKTPAPARMFPAAGEGTLCGVYVKTDDTTGLSEEIIPLRVGPRLQNSGL